MEPGKSIVARAGFLLTKVTYLKKLEKKIAVTDAGMNDMIRVPLYEGKHPIYNLQQRPKSSESIMIVGPICESADYFKRIMNLKFMKVIFWQSEMLVLMDLV